MSGGLAYVVLTGFALESRDEHLVSGTGTEPYQVYSLPIPTFPVFGTGLRVKKDVRE
ncbi:hypothetical protein HanRHA438_Chr15g0690921 [Helianthus annuus]|nr:hypothetical protein HanIR_Chr15g0737261 [Helianthus annuus]KAJ0843398.1 hypothetical protein HanRHA438_Chr15g0690921 [Helianthus annuus]